MYNFLSTLKMCIHLKKTKTLDTRESGPFVRQGAHCHWLQRSDPLLNKTWSWAPGKGWGRLNAKTDRLNESPAEWFELRSQCWYSSTQHDCTLQRLDLIQFFAGCGLWCGSPAARLLGLRVRIPPVAWMAVCCECCVLSGRQAHPSSRGVLPTVVCLSVIKCNNNPLHLQWLGRRGQTKKKKNYHKMNLHLCENFEIVSYKYHDGQLGLYRHLIGL